MHTSSLVAIVVCAPSWANLQAATWLCNATEQGKNNISPREKKHNFLYSKLRRTNTHTTHTHTEPAVDMILPCHVTLLWCYSKYSVFHLHVWFVSVSGSTPSGRRRATSNKGPTYVFICKSVLFTHCNMVERRSASQTAHSFWSWITLEAAAHM